jgi:hypothetical protein
MTIAIEIPDLVADKLQQVLRRTTRPPRQLPDGTVIIEPQFKTIGAYLEQMLAVNIEQLLSQDPENAPEEVKQLREQVNSIYESIRQYYRPTVHFAGEENGKSQDQFSLGEIQRRGPNG